MKNRAYSGFCQGVLLSVLISFCVSSLVSLCSGRSSFSLGSTYNISPSEQELGYNVAKFIKTLAIFRDWERAENYYGAETTVLRILCCAGGGGDDYAMSFYIGHGHIKYYPEETFNKHYCVDDDYGNLAYDFLVHSYTRNRRTRFALLWSCWQGAEIGGFYDSTPYGPYGMPHAWLHTTDLCIDGYANHDDDGKGYTFIGWNLTAPGLTREVDGAVKAGYNFLLNFYCAALYDQKTIRGALDDASDAVWGCTFSESYFYLGTMGPAGMSHMIVYGDGALVLP